MIRAKLSIAHTGHSSSLAEFWSLIMASNGSTIPLIFSRAKYIGTVAG